MKTKSYFVTLLCFCMISVFAQHQLTGNIKDGADGSPFPYATVALLRTDSSAVTGAMTDLDGKFVITNVVTGTYVLQISFIGYEKEYRNIRHC